MKNRFSLSGVLSIVLVVVLLFSAIRSDIKYKNIKDEEASEAAMAAEPDYKINTEDTELESESESEVDNGFKQVGDVQFVSSNEAVATDNTVTPTDEQVAGGYAILVDESTGTILAQKNAKERMNPASMTKILTVLTAAEAIENNDALSYEDTVEIGFEATNYSYVNDCSNAGFMVGDIVKVSDLFYATILPSGADAAVSLALYVAGSQDAFIEMMNQKVEELGLGQTSHFTNAAGIYDEELYSTAYDMSIILKNAVQNDFCREVLGTHVYTIPANENHPEGMVLSNWFLRRIEDHMTDSQGNSIGEVMGAKTGFVNQAGSCAASYEISASGKPYICVVASSYSSWGCIYDHIAMYSNYAK